MDAYIITLKDHEMSETSSAKCIKSIHDTNSNIIPHVFDAVTPATMKKELIKIFGYEVKWNWPMDDHQNGYDLSCGMFKKYYPARDQLRVIACAVSHAKLWKQCAKNDKPIVILEQDSMFLKRFDPYVYEGYEWGAIGLNDPRGATRKSKVYYDLICKHDREGLFKIPDIDTFGSENLPMGLAGNSAYVLKPEAAKDLLEKVKKVGLWPNDALMCKQFFKWLRVSYPFYTTVQGTVSTTTQ